MALLQNQTINAQYPRRLNSGVNSGERAMFGRGNRRNIFAGAAGWSNKSGIPSGNLAPSSWVLPLKPGGIAGRKSAVGVASFSGSIAAGRNLAGTFSGLSDFSGVGQLVVSGSGSFAGVASFSANVVAALNGSGSFSASASFSGAVTAKANASGSFAGVASFEAIRYATGSLSGSFASAVTLEAQGFSSYLLDQEDVESGLTLRQALRLISAAVGGEVSGGGTTTITFKSAVDGVADRIVATVDSNGNRTALTYDLA
jgi:hypothetical protein